MRKKLAVAVLSFLCIFAFAATTQAQSGQNTLTQTSLTADITAGANALGVASATGITTSQNTNATILYVDREEMIVLNVSGTQITVSRGQGGTQAAPHRNHAMVLAGNPTWFFNHDPQGSCLGTPLSTPYVNVINGSQWLCSTITTTWVPGFGNPGGSGTPVALTTLVADAAGVVVPSGPLFQMGGGTNAVTGFTIPVGCPANVVSGCQFTVIPTTAWTWTTAGNIATAGTAVANLAITFRWDATTSKFIVQQSK